MKHASPATLETLAPLRVRLRALAGVVERTPGCFYRGSKAFLHFHDDASGVHADVRLTPDGGFTRLRVHSLAEREALLAAAVKATTTQAPIA